MDQYLSAIIIAIITGIFSVVTIIIQKQQDRVISRIDEQTMIIEKEKELKQKLAKKEKERVETMYKVMILTLETNLILIKMTDYPGNPNFNETIFNESERLKSSFTDVSKDLNEINKEYEMVLDLISEFQKDNSKSDSHK